jgi:carbon storage regulator CsrA
MLDLLRRASQEILIGETITILVKDVNEKTGVVTIGVTAPDDVEIFRGELVAEPLYQIAARRANERAGRVDKAPDEGRPYPRRTDR